MRLPYIGGVVATLIIAMGTSLGAPRIAAADIYFYRDAEGVYHFTSTAEPGTERFQMSRASFAPLRKAPARLDGSQSGKYDDLIAEYAARHGVERALVKAMIRAESGFNPMATSPKGARGLMQLMPHTAKRYGVRNAYDPRDNIQGGVHFLSRLLERFRNNVGLAVAAYNAGSGAVNRYNGIPPYAETQDFVRRVLRFRRDYQREERITQATAY